MIGAAIAVALAGGGGRAPAQPAGSAPPGVERLEHGHPWFEVHRILPGVIAIREPGHWERVISYLVVGTERALLFDTGTGIADLRALVSELTDREVVVVNSHSHPDHVGGNHRFETVYAPDSDTARQNARGRSIEDSRRLVPERAFSQEPPATFSRETYRIHPYRITRHLEDGEVIDLGGRSLEVVLTPGHAPDALCLLDRAHRVVLTGDTFYLGRLFVHPEPGSLAAYASSAERLAALAGDVDRVLPAHSATRLKATFLPRLHRAFQKILKGRADAEVLPDGRREYRFGLFSIVVATASRAPG